MDSDPELALKLDPDPELAMKINLDSDSATKILKYWFKLEIFHFIS